MRSNPLCSSLSVKLWSASANSRDHSSAQVGKVGIIKERDFQSSIKSVTPRPLQLNSGGG
jgi:hypothetical protein